MLKLTKILACYLVFLAAFTFACDAFGADKAPASAPHVTTIVFTYGSQIPGTPMLHTDTAPRTWYYVAPIVIRGKAHGSAYQARNVVRGAMRSHVTRGTLNHASTVMRATYRVVKGATSYMGDLPGAPDALMSGCETVGPRLDGSKVRICAGSVVGYFRADGSFLPGFQAF